MATSEAIAIDWNTPRNVLEQESEKGNPEAFCCAVTLNLAGGWQGEDTRLGLQR